MRVLITGITGFAGGHLAEHLLAEPGVELFGLSRSGEWPRELDFLAGRVVLRRCDLEDGAAVEALLAEVQPQVVYHLAGYAHAGRSFREAEAAWAGNLTATRRLYDAIARWGGQPRIVHVGSGLVYGDGEGPAQPQDERCPLRPASPYAASKAAADLAAYQYTRAPGLDIVRVRPFNHCGPRQSPEYAVAHFAQQIAAIERGRRPPLLETGDLSPRRDLTDVRDVVRAYRLLAEHGRTGEVYNVGTGRTWSMREVLDCLLALAKVAVEVRPRPDLARAAETHTAWADPSQLVRATGWSPAWTLEQSLADILAYWRQRS
ncbi:MAG TPA: GDP-mannose 4,6-dehydratase [Gemmataceae bacterium]|jgi:GDP-4-dehydro-6-deoxy-D-mannose reductase|nr:GDP-mannose 4,6-dehydratase [Gemmataceae bacterium]